MTEQISHSVKCWHWKTTEYHMNFSMILQGRNHSWKVEGGGKIWVPTPGRLRPAPGQRPGWVLSAEGGRPLPLWGSGGIIPGKCFENSHAKSCILVTICCKISCFFENYGQEVGGPIHSWSPNFKVGGPVSPGPTVVAPMWYCIFCSTTYYYHSDCGGRDFPSNFLQTIFENTFLWRLKRLVSLSTYRHYINKCIYLSIYCIGTDLTLLLIIESYHVRRM